MTTQIVTGGAGFIGSHLVDKLVAEGHDVVVVDNLSTGDRSWVNDGATFVEADCGDHAAMVEILSKHDDAFVWHLAADPEVRRGADNPGINFHANVEVTRQLLEAMRATNHKRIAFTSTSTVYGVASVMPTPEDYGPLYPISIYGGCKLACEAIISSYCGTYGFDAQLFRFANVVGPRSNHGVTYDFVGKLRATPERLEILGDGTQHKSYVHVEDTVTGMIASVAASDGGAVAWNIGSVDGIPVSQIGTIVADAMGLSPEYHFTGGKHGGAGWAGDVKHMGLAVDKLLATGWKPKFDSAGAVADTAAWLVANS